LSKYFCKEVRRPFAWGMLFAKRSGDLLLGDLILNGYYITPEG